ncbi:OLC1v1034031C1 [Oldenlandia corymbosa var. corymbosa]|uniref:OLC1v1034031C1 n=1 Tax=Oldenlandia corymbosa var. corymbosa TaxID=529605 RepID=A0AAV1CS83_OLDCO|nr:OLC1v1034031C1 [Oldenlandia corymbosa var. corymbosa]
MAKLQFNLVGISLLVLICLLVPSSSARSTSVKYCSKKDYPVKVSSVDINPYPVQRGKEAKFSISASTDQPISGGKLLIDVSYFGLHIHNENHDLCDETTCPVVKGDFVIAHSQVLPGYTPPGSYTLRMTLSDGKNQLTCINFDFSIGFATSDAVADS